jgi:transcription elongation factor Elf1
MTADNNQQQAMATAARGTQVFFQQGCPVCGRRLEIDVNLLGRRVYCQHCGGGFVAMDASLVTAAAPVDQADDRVDALLERAAIALEQASIDGDTG